MHPANLGHKEHTGLKLDDGDDDFLDQNLIIVRSNLSIRMVRISFQYCEHVNCTQMCLFRQQEESATPCGPLKRPRPNHEPLHVCFPIFKSVK